MHIMHSDGHDSIEFPHEFKISGINSETVMLSFAANVKELLALRDAQYPDTEIEITLTLRERVDSVTPQRPSLGARIIEALTAPSNVRRFG